jgi:nondiscriminating aspartyl-tRNA synthetase
VCLGAEPHATSRHLTEYCSLDLEFGFIDGPEDVIQLERELLGTCIFDRVNKDCASLLSLYRKQPLPSMLEVPCWEFEKDGCPIRMQQYRA